MIVHQVDEKTYFKSWSFPSSSKTSLRSVNYNYLVIVVSIVIKGIRDRLHVMNDTHCTCQLKLILTNAFEPFSMNFMHVLLLLFPYPYIYSFVHISRHT